MKYANGFIVIKNLKRVAWGKILTHNQASINVLCLSQNLSCWWCHLPFAAESRFWLALHGAGPAKAEPMRQKMSRAFIVWKLIDQSESNCLFILPFSLNKMMMDVSSIVTRNSVVYDVTRHSALSNKLNFIIQNKLLKSVL